MSRVAALSYIACWSAVCLAAFVLAALRWRSIALFARPYWRSAARPWKLGTFALATGFFLVVAPHSGDPTWDWFDALFMSVLTFGTAPWALGTVVRVDRRKLPAWQAFVAATVWLFSASWSYDLYIFLRDGFYPPTWSSNLLASSILYAAAGMMWSLEHRPVRGLTFAFLEAEWFVPQQTGRGGTARVVGFALLFMALVAGMMLPFVWDLLPAFP